MEKLLVIIVLLQIALSCEGNVTFCNYTHLVYGTNVIPHDCHVVIPSYLKPEKTDQVQLTFWKPWTSSIQINGFICQTIETTIVCETSFWGSQKISEIPRRQYISSKKCQESPILEERVSASPECEWWSTRSIVEITTIKRPVWGTILENGSVFFPEIGQPIHMIPNYHQIGSMILIWKEPPSTYQQYSCHYTPIRKITCTRTLGTTHGNSKLYRYNCSSNYVTFRDVGAPKHICIETSSGGKTSLYLTLSKELISEVSSLNTGTITTPTNTGETTISTMMLQDEINKIIQESMIYRYRTRCESRNILIRTLQNPTFLTELDMELLYGHHGLIGLYEGQKIRPFRCYEVPLVKYQLNMTVSNQTYCYNSSLGQFVDPKFFDCNSAELPILLSDQRYLYPNNSVINMTMVDMSKLYVYPEPTVIHPSSNEFSSENFLYSTNSIRSTRYYEVFYQNPILTSISKDITPGDFIKSVINLLFWICICYGSYKLLKLIGIYYLSKKNSNKKFRTPIQEPRRDRLMSID